jgi:hypothetical protein
MQYLLELNEFEDDNIRLQQICNKIVSSGYVSKSAEKEIDSISGISNFFDILYARINEVCSFYEKYDKEFFEDVLLEFFDGTPYKYTVKIEADFQTMYGDKINIPLDQFAKEFKDVENKEVFLLEKMISAIIKYNKNEIEKAKGDSEKLKKSGNWMRNPRGRSIKHKTCFKHFNKFNPVIGVDIMHDEYSSYYDLNYGEPKYLNGIPQKQFSTYPETALLSRIKNRFSRIGNCTINTSYYNTFTDSRWYIGEDEEGNNLYEENPNPVLLRGSFTIKF